MKKTSNWREATDLVDRIEELAEEEAASGSEVIVLTDNEVFDFLEGSLYVREAA